MLLVKSQFGGDQIIDDELYRYRIKDRSSRVVRWICVVKTCTASARTALDYFLNLITFNRYKPHNHVPNVEQAVKIPLINEMKEKIIGTNDSPRNVAYSCIRGADISILRALGPFDLLCRVLRDFRLKYINPAPYENITLSLNENLLKTHLGTDFFQYGPEKFRELVRNDDVVIFYSDHAITRIKESNFLAVDGTFSVVPEPYYQLYTVSYIKEHHVFPCVFALLKNKNQETYNFLFATINNLIGPLTPTVIKSDFEISAINALRINFPGARVSGCLFHLGQAIDRKIKDLTLTNTYATNWEFRKYAKALMALAYVKHGSLIDQFNLLKAQDTFPQSILPLYNYFYLNFLAETARFPSTIWHTMNVNDPQIPRTNNAIEGWHNTFANTFGLCRHSFYMLIKKLKDEEDVIRMRSIQQDELNHTFERRRRYVVKEERLAGHLVARRGNEEGIEFIFDIVALLNY